MKCPYCDYRYDWEYQGERGRFYTATNDIKMERGEFSYDKDSLSLIGCPNCKKVFIEYN